MEFFQHSQRKTHLKKSIFAFQSKFWALFLMSFFVLAPHKFSLAQGIDVYRGINMTANNELNFLPGALNYNPNLSLSNAALAGLTNGQPTHPCFLTIRLTGNPAPNGQTTAIDFPATVVFDNNPNGHYSMQPSTVVPDGTALSTMIKTMYQHAEGEFDMLLRNGTRNDCVSLELLF